MKSLARPPTPSTSFCGAYDSNSSLRAMLFHLRSLLGDIALRTTIPMFKALPVALGTGTLLLRVVIFDQRDPQTSLADYT